MDTKFVSNLSKLFKDEYKESIILSPTQQEIFRCVVQKKHNKVGVITPTQYGKSLSTALGIIVRATALPEEFVIIGGTKSKADIIMGYIIDHLFDNELFSSQLQIEGGKLEQLRRERKRDHLTFKRGGEIKTMSAEYRNKRKIGDALIGKGGKNIIIDDSVLCDDEQYAFIRRMTGGRKDTFVMEISNPLKRNHFYTTMTADKTYHKVWINYEIALAEKRYSQDFIEDMRKLKFFDILYGCKFPTADEIDDKGFMRLLLDSEVDNAVGVGNLEGELFMGVDLGRGGNRNVICVRGSRFAKITRADKVADTTQITGGVILTAKEHNISMKNVCIDDGGLAGTSDRLKEQHYAVNGIKFGSKSNDDDFANKRAEMYWNMRNWIKGGGVIENNDDLINQLREIRYKTNSSGKILIESKEDMAMRGVESPDEADALALTFACSRKGKVHFIGDTSKKTDEGDTDKKTDEQVLSDFYKEQVRGRINESIR